MEKSFSGKAEATVGILSGFFVSKYLVSRNCCPLSGDCESLPKKRAIWTSCRALASDIKLAVCFHLETLFGIAE